jgi:hypothetical protein
MIVTLAPLTTAPDGSVTVPTMLPVLTVDCANSPMLISKVAPKTK